MTRPLEDRNVVGIEGRSYKVGSPRCANPSCRRWAEHAHHMWSRSAMGNKSFNWIQLPDGRVVANLVGLCPRCHGDLHDGRARIDLDTEALVFNWVDRVEQTVAPLDPQPPTPDVLDERQADNHEHGAGEVCPTCGQTRRRSAPPLKPGERRRRKTWTIKVPDEAQEDGADALDSLLDDLAPYLGYEADAGARYYVVMASLVYAQQDKQRFLDSIRGVGA